MKHTITKNDKNLRNLDRLISDGFYKGYLEPKKFELKRNSFPNNYRLIGILNDSGKFELKFDFKSPMNIMIKILFIAGILISIISAVRSNWIITIVFIIFGFVMTIDFKLKKKREFKYFDDRFLGFDNN